MSISIEAQTKKSTNSVINPKYNRTFSEAFKRHKVEQISSKILTVKQVSELYEVSRVSVYKWLRQYSDLPAGFKTVVQMESESLKTKVLAERVAELERIIGQKQLEIDYLEKTIELTNSELGYDIKKKYGVQSWSISEQKGV